MAMAAYKKAHPNDTRIDDPLLQPVSGWDVGIFLTDILKGWELIVFSGITPPPLPLKITTLHWLPPLAMV